MPAGSEFLGSYLEALLVGMALPWILFLVFAWIDRRRPPEKRDEWGPWGVLLAAGAISLPALAYPVAVVVLAIAARGPTSGEGIVLAVYGGLTLLSVSYLYVSLRRRRVRLMSGMGQTRG
jgi:TRAP-type C4-dicarboxylate transport system permease large subunit